MKKIFSIVAILLSLVMFMGVAVAVEQNYWAYVYSATTNAQMADPVNLGTRVESGITFKVLAVDADTSETLTYFNGSTSLTNPVTTTSYASDTICNDMVSFRCDPTDATSDRYVDLIVVDTAGGYTAFVENFDQYTHTIVIDERPGVMHHGMIWALFLVAGTEVDTGIDFDYDSFIHDVWIEVVTVDAGETIDVGILSSGTAGDANGYRTLVSVATAGYPTDTAVITGGTNIDYVPVTTYGALLATAITGSDAVATCGGKSYIGHVVTAANEQSLTYTPSAGDTFYGYIHYFFTRMR